MRTQEIQLKLGKITLHGTLTVPDDAIGIVLFSHGSGSGRHSPRNQFVARELNRAKMATLLLDLLTKDEEAREAAGGMLRFNIELLTERLQAAAIWCRQQESTSSLSVALFGASTGAASALCVAANLPKEIVAVVSRGGRPDLATPNALAHVECPTLLIVGGEDHIVIELNRRAFAQLHCEKKIEIIPSATHLFEEPGTLEEVARLAMLWFRVAFEH